MYCSTVAINKSKKNELKKGSVFAFSQDKNDFYENKRKAFDNLYFFIKTKLPFTHFSFSSKVETQVTKLKQVNRKQHSTIKQPLTNILIKKKKKILLQKLQLIQILDVTRTKQNI